jgi:hypothetical protein
MDAHDQAALAHYQALVANLDCPPILAAALAAARYQHQLTHADLPVLRDTLEAVASTNPDLRRDIGRTVAAIERRGRPKKVA